MSSFFATKISAPHPAMFDPAMAPFFPPDGSVQDSCNRHTGVWVISVVLSQSTNPSE